MQRAWLIITTSAIKEKISQIMLDLIIDYRNGNKVKKILSFRNKLGFNRLKSFFATGKKKRNFERETS